MNKRLSSGSRQSRSGWGSNRQPVPTKTPVPGSRLSGRGRTPSPGRGFILPFELTTTRPARTGQPIDQAKFRYLVAFHLDRSPSVFLFSIIFSQIHPVILTYLHLRGAIRDHLEETQLELQDILYPAVDFMEGSDRDAEPLFKISDKSDPGDLERRAWAPLWVISNWDNQYNSEPLVVIVSERKGMQVLAGQRCAPCPRN
ncbi:hypothetical protein PG994_010044 [Apiospora phragmitis]|uniref:Uncharacterized protein n=1 Tax=Apiospora phragmitis TaxID=2905665 RepID=A0ABR1TNS7_9PEZI